VRGARTAGSARSVAFALGGLAAGSLTVVRPTALLFALAALAWMLRTQRRDAGVFTLALLAGAAPGVIWNLINFHSLAGGYAGDAAGYRISPDVLAAWLALAISPSKGLVWYLPFVVLAPLGAVLAARSARTGDALLAWLGAAGALLAASYGFYAQWWGGASFGPRFLTDLDAVVVLLLVPLANPLLTQLRARHPAALAATALFAVVTAYAIGVQVAGANGESPSEWSAIPRSLDTHPARMWATTDTQIGRNHAARRAPRPAARYSGDATRHRAGTALRLHHRRVDRPGPRRGAATRCERRTGRHRDALRRRHHPRGQLRHGVWHDRRAVCPRHV
jgi:hypothetical protein